MNTALALEIYRGLWVVESSSADSLKNILRDARMPGVIYDPKNRANTFSFLNISTGPQTAASGNSNSSTKKKIAVTNINGVITKSGGPSSAGMEEISQDMVAADNDPEVLGHFMKVDSPGGSAVGMKYMQKTMQSLTKPIVTFVPRQGMAASGGYGILSEGQYVMAESDDAEVGSVGVIWGVSGVPNGQKDANGEVNFVVVSSTSPDKNKAPLAAINNNDTSLMQKEVDELHVGFKASTRASRTNIREDQMTGAMYPASQVVGTMIDAIGTEQQAIGKIIELSKVKINNNPISKTAMNEAQLLAEHPALHAQIFGAGVAAERDRVDTWMVFHALDPQAVQKGIESGKAVSNKEMAAFNLKAATTGALANLQRDSQGNILTQEAKTEKVVEKTAKELADEKEFNETFGKYGVKFEGYKAIAN